VMDYLCAKFGDFNFSRFDFVTRTDRQTESVITHRDRITEVDQRYTHANTVCVSKGYYTEQLMCAHNLKSRQT